MLQLRDFSALFHPLEKDLKVSSSSQNVRHRSRQFLANLFGHQFLTAISSKSLLLLLLEPIIKVRPPSLHAAVANGLHREPDEKQNRAAHLPRLQLVERELETVEHENAVLRSNLTEAGMKLATLICRGSVATARGIRRATIMGTTGIHK